MKTKTYAQLKDSDFAFLKVPEKNYVSQDKEVE